MTQYEQYEKDCLEAAKSDPKNDEANIKALALIYERDIDRTRALIKELREPLLFEKIESLKYQLRQMERAMESIKAAIGHAERDIKREQTK